MGRERKAMIVTRPIESPRDYTYAEVLRFLVQTADVDDPSLNFIINIWNVSLQKGGLTTKQAKLIEPYIDASQQKYKWGVSYAK